MWLLFVHFSSFQYFYFPPLKNSRHKSYTDVFTSNNTSQTITLFVNNTKLPKWFATQLKRSQMRLPPGRRQNHLGKSPAQPDAAGNPLHIGNGKRAKQQSYTSGGVRRHRHHRTVQRGFYGEAGQKRIGFGDHDYRYVCRWICMKSVDFNKCF